MPTVTVTPRNLTVTVTGSGIAVGVTTTPISVAVGSPGSTVGTSTPTPPGGTNGQPQFNNNGVFGGLTNAALTTHINTATTTLSGAVPASGGGTANFLRADLSWAVPPTVALPDIGGVAGTYDNATLTVNVKGLVIAAASGTGPGGNPTYANRLQLQNAIDVACAAGGGLITVLNTVALDGPLLIWGSHVRLDGQGIGTLDGLGSYIGAQLIVGPATHTAVSNSHRPASVLDSSAAPGRTGLATLGTHSLLIACDGIQYGCTGGGLPLYYQDDALTVEFCIVCVGTIGTSVGLLGMDDGRNAPDPVAFYMVNSSTLGVGFTTSDGAIHTEPQTAFNQALPKNHCCFQRTVSTGLTTLFLNGTRVFNQVIAPGLRLRKPVGFSPFGIGFTAGFAPMGTAPANIQIHALKLSGGDRYDPTLTTQTLRRGGTPDDNARYFAPVSGDPPLIGYLPMNGPGVVPGTEPVAYTTGNGVAFWCDSTRSSATADYNSVTGMTFLGDGQSTILFGEELFATVENCTSINALNSAASLALSAGEKYDVKFYNCFFSGYDCPLVFQNLIYETYGMDFPTFGKDGIRENNCDAAHYGRLWFATPLNYTDYFISVYGGIHSSNGVSIDDENGGPNLGYYYCMQGPQLSRLQINKLDTSIGSKPYLTLAGINAGSPPTDVQVNALACFGAQQDATFLVQTGPKACFIGEVNATGIGSTAFTTENGTLLNIRNRDTAFLVGPKEAVTGSKASGAALTSLLAKLVAKGLITDSTSA